MAERNILINRAPVLTLWATTVAERLGFDQDARQAPSFRAGKDSADSEAVVCQSGVFCCSMYWRTTLMGAPPQEQAK